MSIKKNADMLFLHGWGINKNVWNDFAALFSDDETIKAPCLYSIAEQADDHSFLSMASLLSKDIKKDTVVIGWSIGGLIAICLSAMNKNIKALVFIASTPCFVNKEQWSNTIENKELEKLQKNFSLDSALALENFSGLIAHGDKQARQTLKYLRRCLAEQQYVDILSSWLLQIKENDLRHDYKSLNVPACILLGENDALIKPEIKQQLKCLNENVTYKTLKGCGHAPFISSPVECKRIIAEFING